MIVLKGKTLGERQKELNTKVKEAALNNVDFDEIKDKTENTDVDKLFKIDLASKYMNIEYIIEVLKSGDSLYISRALQCQWMYDDEFSNIINVDYLQNNVFPVMSLKMKKKLLSTMSIHIRNADRAAACYKYCMDMKLNNIAMKFLIHTSDEFKSEVLKKNGIGLKYKNNFKHMIGSSFTLADIHLSSIDYEFQKAAAFIEICYLYTVSDVKYLDMMEKHLDLNLLYRHNHLPQLGLRISKSILTKHKERVLKKPAVYILILNKSCIVKFSTPENAKIYAPALLPPKAEQFWNMNFCSYYEHLFNILPPGEKFGFIKKIFHDKYGNEPFEMNLDFYRQQYYRFMTDEEKEKWALDHVASQKEILGIGKDYIWYKFVNFDRAFEEIKKLVIITTDNNKRADIVNILIESAKSQRDLEKLFNYYYDRHNNEQRYTKENFIGCVLHAHNVYKFDKDCWVAFNKLFQNLDVYSMLDYNNCKSDFKIIALIYHIVNGIEVHDALKLYISTNMYFYTLKLNTDKLTKEQQEMVYKYLFKYYMDKIYEFDAETYCDEVKYKLRKYIYFILDLLKQYDRTKDDIPEVVMKLMKLDWDEFSAHKLHYEQRKKTTTEDLIRFLKKDSKLAVDNLPLVKSNIENNYRFNIGKYLKKLKVYFPNDVSKEYLKFYNELLKEEKLYSKIAQAAVYGIFQLADNNFKVNFMLKHAPIHSKVNRAEIDEKLLTIQEAICATAYYSRPPVPLKSMLMYVKGDYTHYCLPMFNSYLANLPLPLCMEFIQAILNTPVAVQKHGLRLAFSCFNAENLRKLILYIWKKTKNVSLRLIIYKALFNKIVHENENAQTALFETLTKLTSGIHQDDDNEVFELMTSGKLPKQFTSDYMNDVWTVVSALPKNHTNLERMNNVIYFMCSNIETIRKDVIRPIVIKFVEDVFRTEDSEVLSSDENRLNEKKWELTALYITHVQNEDDLTSKWELTKLILSNCLNKFNLVKENKYVMRQFLSDFLKHLTDHSYYIHNRDCYAYVHLIFENVLQFLQHSFPIEAIYLDVWGIRIEMATSKALDTVNSALAKVEEEDKKSAIFRDNTLNYGKDIGNLIKEYIDKEMYFKAFWPNILNILLGKMRSIVSWAKLDISMEDVLVVTSKALMEFKMTELYLIAVAIVPSDYSGVYSEDYKSVLNEIIECNDVEIKCQVFNKFVHVDYKPRDFLQL